MNNTSAEFYAFDQCIQNLVAVASADASARVLQEALDMCHREHLALARREHILRLHLGRVAPANRPLNDTPLGDERRKTCALCQDEHDACEVCSLGCKQCLDGPELCFDCRRRVSVSTGACPYCRAQLKPDIYGTSVGRIGS